MKIGDKVILKEYEGNSEFSWKNSDSQFVGKEALIIGVDNSDNSFEFICCGFRDWWLQSAVEIKPKERYFLFAYIYNGGSGSLTATNHKGEMPNYEYINSQVKIANRTSHDIGIVNIFEFKSKEDYEQFNYKNK